MKGEMFSTLHGDESERLGKHRGGIPRSARNDDRGSGMSTVQGGDKTGQAYRSYKTGLQRTRRELP
jgi:hypothetical protein